MLHSVDKMSIIAFLKNENFVTGSISLTVLLEIAIDERILKY
jgi:hypothetical protein